VFQILRDSSSLSANDVLIDNLYEVSESWNTLGSHCTVVLWKRVSDVTVCLRDGPARRAGLEYVQYAGQGEIGTGISEASKRVPIFLRILQNKKPPVESSQTSHTQSNPPKQETVLIKYPNPPASREPGAREI